MAGNDSFTKLLLHCDGTDGSTSFPDASGSIHTVTAQGTAQVDTAQQKFGTASALFDGNSDYLSIAHSDDFNPEDGDFTADMWIRFNSTANPQVIMGHNGSSDRSWSWYYNGGNLRFSAYFNGTTNDIPFAWTPSTATWYHIAVVRQGADLMMFVDGTAIGTTYNISTHSIRSSVTSEFWIGENVEDRGYYVNGWMDEIRWSKGIARWNSNFITATEAYDNSPGFDIYTKLMLHMDGSDASTTFIDSSNYSHVMTANGDAQIDTAQSVFGGASGVFDGSDYVSTNDSDDFYLNGDFTIDFRIRWNGSVPESGIYGQSEGGGGVPKYAIYWGVSALGMSNALGIHISTGTDVIFDTWNPSADTWYHVEVVRSGNNFYLFINGTQQGVTKVSSISFPNVTASPRVGMDGEGFKAFNGWIDEFRLSNGIARHTSNFTIPTSAYKPFQELAVAETLEMTDSWNLFTNPEQFPMNETMEISDSWFIEDTPKMIDEDETLQISDSWSFSLIEDVNSASRILSINPLIIVTDTNPAKIVEVDVSDPTNPTWTVTTLVGVSNAKDICLDSVNDNFYIACADGKISVVDKDDFNTQSQLDTGDTNDLTTIDCMDLLNAVYIGTDEATGELYMLDNRLTVSLDTDIRFNESKQYILQTFINSIEGKKLECDIRFNQLVTSALRVDLRSISFLPTTVPPVYNSINLDPVKRTDFHVKINGTEVGDCDLDLTSIVISKIMDTKSIATFVLARRHDDLDRDIEGNASQITNQNSVEILIKTQTVFTGNVFTLQSNSQGEVVTVTAKGNQPAVNFKTIGVPLPTLNAETHLYDAFLINPNIDYPILDPNDTSPPYFSGIKANLGIETIQSVSRLRYFGSTGDLANNVTDGSFKPRQNYSYFWFGRGTKVPTGQTSEEFSDTYVSANRELQDLSYVGTTLSGFTGDIWLLTGVSYHRQREFDDIVNELGEYTVGSAPFNEISPRNGKLKPKDKWEDKSDGLYRVRDAGYDFTDYAQQVVDIEYDKLKNINGSVFPKTKCNIELSIDGYLYYNPSLLTRINVTNTTKANIYNNNHGFPVAVKNIQISSSTMKTTLTCDNNLSKAELDALDDLLPDETSDEFNFEAEEVRQFRKFDPNRFENVE